MPFAPRIVLVTASSMEEARTLAQAILDKRLAACVSIVPGVESHYWWKGQAGDLGRTPTRHQKFRGAI